MMRDNVLKENSIIQIQGGTSQHSMRDVVVSGNTFTDFNLGIGISA